MHIYHDTTLNSLLKKPKKDNKTNKKKDILSLKLCVYSVIQKLNEFFFIGIFALQNKQQ